MSGIGDLVAYLTVNHAGFRQGFAAAQGIASRGAAGITASIAPIAGALAPLTAALGAAFGAGSALSAAREDLRAMQKLEAVLRSTGGAAGFTAQEIGGIASELQQVTNFGDEATVSAASILAGFRNLNGDNFKQAISLAQDMATVLEIDLDSAAKKLGKSLRDVKPEAVGAKLAQMQAQFGGAAAAVADPWTQLKNTIGDIGEQVGNFLLPHVNNLSEALNSVASQGVETFSSLQNSNQEWADAISITYSTLGDQAYLWYLQTELAVVQAGAAFGHFFTQELPVWLTWLGDNWSDVFFTMGDYALTILVNLGENIRTVWQAVLDFFAGNPINLDFKGLTEGAVSAIKEMPDIPERITTEFEKSLMDDIKAQEDFLRQAQEDAAGAIFDNRAAKDAAKKGMASPTAMETKGKPADMKVGALAKGSADALSAVFKAMRGGDKQDKMLNAAETQVEQNEEMVSLLRDIKDGSGVGLVAGSLA